MKTRLVLLVAIVSTLMGLFACTQAAPQAVTVEESTDDITKSSTITKQTEVANGGTVTVILASNTASTGFSWNAQAQIADTSILEQTNHETIAPTAGIPGAPGKDQWSFKALKNGTTTVHMEYSQPWEGGQKGVWKFTLTVTVESVE